LARTAISAPIVPPAPDRLSAMNCWPNSAVSRAANMRATISVPPPGASGTIMRTVFSGHLAGWACAAGKLEASVSSIAHVRETRRCVKWGIIPAAGRRGASVTSNLLAEELSTSTRCRVHPPTIHRMLFRHGCERAVN
jgi:hypothetical protein